MYIFVIYLVVTMSNITQVTFKLSHSEAAGFILGHPSFNSLFHGAEGYRLSISENTGPGIYNDKGSKIRGIHLPYNTEEAIQIALKGAYRNAFENEIPIYFGNPRAKYEFILLPTPNCVHCWADITKPWGRIDMGGYAQATIVREAGGVHIINCAPNVREQSQNSLRRYHIPEECLRDK